MNRRPRLRTVLLAVNLLVLILPLAGIGVLRIYESALVRQTESELVAQGAFVGAAYKAAVERRLLHTATGAGGYGIPIATRWLRIPHPEDRWQPQPARLDLAVDPVYPPPPPALAATRPADRIAVEAGRELAALMRDAQSVTLAAIRIVDARGVVVATTGEELGLSLAVREEVARALSGEHVSILRQRVSDEPPPGIRSISRANDVRVFVAMPVVRDNRVLGAVALARTPTSLAQTLYRHRTPLLAGLTVLLAVVLTVSVLTAFAIARPFAALIRQTERAARGERGAVTALAHPGTREVAQLSEAVAHMARALEERGEYIRNFAAHVSHEFKTPLTAMQGAVELLREHGPTMSDAERSRFLDNIAANTDRLGRLVRKLLELARADVMQPASESVDAKEVMAQVAARCREQGLAVTVDETGSHAPVTIDGDTLDSVLSNLLDNARQHSGRDVQVWLGARSEEDSVVLTVRDNGPGISDANAARVFEPFFTTARSQGGTGLGLAVVRALVRAHGGEVWLGNSGEHGSTFHVRLPRVKHR